MRHGSLFLKYAIPLVILSSGAVIASGLVEMFFSYQESKTALARVQHEKAVAAAVRIEQFARDLEHQIAWIAQAPWGPRGVTLDQRRLDSLRLLRQVPAITEVSHLDLTGHEQLRVSRLAMDVIGSGSDFSLDPKFTESRNRKTYFSPVYFRKESEPYMTIALAGSGENAGVVVAEANLKFIWDVVSGMKIGQGGHAYVVDANGRLIAHPDISLVLQNTDLSSLALVRAATRQGVTNGAPVEAITGKDVQGREVLSASAPVAALGWTVFVDLPLREALAPLYSSLVRTGVLLLVGLGISILASLVLVRRMVAPIRVLQTGAARIGAGALDQRIEVKTGDELQVLGEEFNRMAERLQESHAGLEHKVEERTRDLTEALEQQTATSEILRVISQSQRDVQPVFEAIARNARKLCKANWAVFYTFDGELIRYAATDGMSGGAIEATLKMFPMHPSQGSALGRAILTRAVASIPDVHEDSAYRLSNLAQTAGYRSTVSVPVLRDNLPIGAISVSSTEPSMFSERQVGMLRTFADQAVIAIENVRLFNELEERNKALGEALEQQTATSEILRVISSSPTDVQPVLNAVAESAGRLCDGDTVAILRVQGNGLKLAAAWGSLPALRTDEIIPIRREFINGRAILERKVVHVPDYQAESNEEFGEAKAYAARLGFKAALSAPMLREDSPIGVILVERAQARAFSGKQIEMLQTFADQAVIAIENVRLFNETKEALEQQTATAEVLEVISSSVADTQPVFAKILQSCRKLFASSEQGIVLVTPQGHVTLAAHDGPALATLREIYDGAKVSAEPYIEGILRGRPIHFIDALDPGAHWTVRSIAQRLQMGPYSQVLAPMTWEGRAVGYLYAIRQPATGFSDKEIALLETFAAQAVIAIQNARLFKELEERNKSLTEALEQQTATSEILRVISQSHVDAKPVFDTIAERARALCAAAHVGVSTFDGQLIHVVAFSNVSPHGADAIAASFPMAPNPHSAIGKAILDCEVVAIDDVSEVPEYGLTSAAKAVNFRSALAVPMLRNGKPIGAISIMRAQPGPFSSREIDVLKTFADQAVIAIENVRLFRELEQRNTALTEALDYQTATSDVLKAISRTTFDLDAVLTTLVSTVMRLCKAQQGGMFRLEDGAYRWAAGYGVDGLHPEYLAIERAARIRPGRGSVVGRAALERQTVQIVDAWNDPEYEGKDGAKIGGVRSMLGVPLMRDNIPIGVFAVARTRVEPFTPKEIELVTTFADQAVIAIENVRLFQELQSRTDELGKSVGQLHALSEVGQAVNSTLDLEQMLSTIVTRAVQLSSTDSGAVYEYEEATEQLRLRATYGLEPELVDMMLAKTLRLGEGATGMAAQARMPVEIADIRGTSQYDGMLQHVIERAGVRSLLSIPLLREGRVLGGLSVSRRIEGTFPPEVTELLQTFAAQSAVAIQNARLFREIEQKSRELEIASQHKSQFLANMSHELRTPLNAILGYTELIVDGIYGEVPKKIREVQERVQKSGRHLLGLINDVLDLSKIEAGQLSLALSDYSLDDVVQTVVTSVESLAAEKGLQLSAEVAPRLPVGRGDERRIAQVLLNLVGNAIKFTDKGKVLVSVAAADGKFVISVHDTGPGIPVAEQERIFEEFRQVDSSATRAKGGSGLGLAIARRIVEMHRGRIWVESATGKGSTFFISIPIKAELQGVIA